MRSKLRVIPCLILLLPLDLIVAIGILLAQIFPSSQRRSGAKREPDRAKPEKKPRRGGQSGVNVSAGLTTPSAPSAQVPLLCEEGNVVATVVILNLDGKHLLAECLPAVIEAVKYAGGKHEVVVVDIGRADGSVQFVQDSFPVVRILALDGNYGFTGGNNHAANRIDTDIIVFLNSHTTVDQRVV